MTVLDDRPLTGLTTPFSGVSANAWQAAPGLTTIDRRVRKPKSRSVRISPAGDGHAGWDELFLRDVEKKINRLLELPAGWDGRRARPVGLQPVAATLHILLALMNSETLPVQLFPLPDGGIQIEWHVAGNSIEIEVAGDGEAFVTAESSDGEVLAEGDLDFSSMGGLMRDTRRFLARLSHSAAAR